MATDDPSDNPFIRFKKYIDSNVQRGFHTVFGSSTATATKTNNSMSADNSDRNSYLRKPESSTSSSEMPDHDKSSADTSADDVLSWAISSPYSPVNLQSLPQPRPNDAPPDSPDCFTFRDAFEDLLAASDRRKLTDLRKLLFVKQYEYFRWSPRGMPIENWVGTLGLRGLWGTYFPLSSSAEHELLWGVMSPRIKKTFDQPKIFKRTTFRHGEFHFLQSDRDWMKYFEAALKPEAETAQHQEADTEEALYTNTLSKYTTGNQAGTDAPLAKPINTKLGSTRGPDPSDSAAAPVTQTIETPDGGKILKTVKQRTRDGRTKTTTTTRQFDADGNLISESKESTWKWSLTFPDTTSSFDEANSDSSAKATTSSSMSGEASIRGSGRVNSWFWR